MTRKHQPFARKGYLGLPNLILLGVWLLLWIAWPSVKPASSVRRVHKMRVTSAGAFSPDTALVVETLLFLPSGASHRRSGSPPPPARPTDYRSAVEPISLPPPPPEWRVRLEKIISDTATLPQVAPPVYRPPQFYQSVYRSRVSAQPRLLVETSRSLEQRGLILPGIAFNDKRGAERSWQVTLRLSFNAAGDVDNVFVERPTDDLELNVRLTRQIRRARLAQPGEPCVGRITISYGRE